MDEIWIFFGPNDFILDAIKVPFFDFIQKMSHSPSSLDMEKFGENSKLKAKT